MTDQLNHGTVSKVLLLSEMYYMCLDVLYVLEHVVCTWMCLCDTCAWMCCICYMSLDVLYVLECATCA